MNLNRVILIGRLTKDPELRTVGQGIENVRFTLAVSRPFTNQAGERQADFINCVAWRTQAKLIGTYLKQGALISVEGSIQTGRFERDGKTEYTTDVVVDNVQSLEARDSGDNRQQNQTRSNQAVQSSNDDNEAYYNTSKQIIADDDLPF